LASQILSLKDTQHHEHFSQHFDNFRLPYTLYQPLLSNSMTMTVRFHLLFLVVALFAVHFEAAVGLSTNGGPTFSISEQALFGGYSSGEASLFGSGSVMYGSQPLWKGNQQTATDTPPPKVPFSGDRVESMTFFVPKSVNGNNNHGSSSSAFTSGK
jgi:hypothetical protein